MNTYRISATAGLLVITMLALLSACTTTPMVPMASSSALPQTVQPPAPHATASASASMPMMAPAASVQAPIQVTVHASAPAAKTHQPPVALAAISAAPVVPAAPAAKPALKPQPQASTSTRQRLPHAKAPVKATTRMPRIAISPPHSKPTLQQTQIQGRITLSASSEQPVSAADLANTLIYFVPTAAAARALPHPGNFTVYTSHHQFNPGAIAIPLGSTLHFTNLDGVDHNVYSATPGSSFNLGYQSHGETTSHAFAHDGLVVINCNVHSSMEVDVMVVPSTYVTRSDTSGRFTLHGLPTGPGTLYVWNPRAHVTHRALNLPSSTPFTVNLTTIKPRLATEFDVRVQP
ncbi:MAG: hypothetical protein L0H70_05000 [Xanthomonadales bacterium]|nr:hypothetical protein [Xanthomonadales bacterium]